MLTKKGYAEQLIDLLYPNVTEDAKLDEQVAQIAVSQARDAYVRNAVLANKFETNIIYGNWVSSFYKQPIQYDKERCEYYTELPVRVIALPNNAGVQRVFFKGRVQDEIIPVPMGFKSMFKLQIEADLEGEWGYYLNANRIYYIQDMNSDHTVSIDLIASAEDLDEDAYFPVDTSATQEILSAALQLYQLQKGIPEDVLNNGISE